MFPTVAAGLAYFVMAFGAGFLLGTVRVFLLIPRLGETIAVIVELPIMLLFCWVTARWLIACFDVAPRMSRRLAMGGLAFALLMLGELGISTIGFGRTIAGHVDQFADRSAILGLAGQIAFAMFPAMQLGTRPRERAHRR